MRNNLLLKVMMCSRYVLLGFLLQSLLVNILPAANADAQEIKSVKEVYIDISLSNAPIADVFRLIEQKTSYRFSYDRHDLNNRQRLDINEKTISVADLLMILSERGDLKFRQINNYINVSKLNKEINDSPKLEIIIQTRNITGTVTSQEDGTLPGVNVIEKGTLNGTVTDMDGRYSIAVAEGAVLVFSSVGYTTTEVTVDNRLVVDLVMTPDIKALEEIVVVGYGTQKAVNLTGSITVVKAEELAGIPVPTISQSLMGRSPGVFIKNKQGQPGEDGVDINIRGFGEPLFIVDGTPVSRSFFQQLESSDIETINVLKDAASAAVYGARAGNGVILVTTKRGSVSPPAFTFSSNYGLQYITRMQQPVSSYQYAEMENVANFNMGNPIPWTEEEIQKFRDGSDPVNYPNSDFAAAVLRPYAPQSQHNINARGGTESVKYFTSLSYFQQGGMLRSNEIDHNRLTLRSNVDIKLTRKFDLGFDLSFTNQQYIGPRHDLERKSSAIGIMTRILRARSYWSLEPHPDPTKIVAVGSGGSDNPIAMMYMDQTGFKQWKKLYGYAKLNFAYELPLGFRARAIFDLNRTYDRFKDKAIKAEQYDYNRETGEYIVRRVLNDDATLYESNATTENVNQQYFLTWDREFGDHEFNAVFVHEILSSNYDFYWASRRDFEFPLNYLFAGSEDNKDNSGYASEGGRLAYVGRINYNYRGKYMFEVNSRWDASPNFPPDTRWGVFPSASIGWRLSEESFMKDNLPFLNNMKIRASVGRLGYDRAGAFQYMSTYSLASRYIFEEGKMISTIEEDQLPNPRITWEKMSTRNAGIDFNIFGNRLAGSIDYFYRKRTDVLGQRAVSIPNVVGATMPRENFLEFDNRGWEFMLDYANNIGGLTYSIGGNVAWNREKTLYRDQSEFSTMEAWRTGNQIGQWTDRWWTLPTDGLFKTQEEIDAWADIDGQGNRSIKPGDVKFIDSNGDGRITNEDMIIAGRGVNPRFFYGLQGSVRWKGFDFNMLWQGAGLYNFNLRHNTGYLSMPFYSGINPQTFMYEEYYTPENPWIPANTNARWPIYRYDQGNRSHRSYAASQHWLIDGSYIRLKNIQIGYSLPNALVERIGIKNLRVYASGYNVLTISDLSNYVDPEIDTNPSSQFGDYHPPLGLYNFGVQLNF